MEAQLSASPRFGSSSTPSDLLTIVKCSLHACVAPHTRAAWLHARVHPERTSLIHGMTSHDQPIPSEGFASLGGTARRAPSRSSARPRSGHRRRATRTTSIRVWRTVTLLERSTRCVWAHTLSSARAGARVCPSVCERYRLPQALTHTHTHAPTCVDVLALSLLHCPLQVYLPYCSGDTWTGTSKSNPHLHNLPTTGYTGPSVCRSDPFAALAPLAHSKFCVVCAHRAPVLSAVATFVAAWSSHR